MSSTSSVIAIANTPSLNASVRPVSHRFFTARRSPGGGFGSSAGRRFQTRPGTVPGHVPNETSAQAVTATDAGRGGGVERRLDPDAPAQPSRSQHRLHRDVHPGQPQLDALAARARRRGRASMSSEPTSISSFRARSSTSAPARVGRLDGASSRSLTARRWRRRAVLRARDDHARRRRPAGMALGAAPRARGRSRAEHATGRPAEPLHRAGSATAPRRRAGPAARRAGARRTARPSAFTSARGSGAVAPQLVDAEEARDRDDDDGRERGLRQVLEQRREERPGHAGSAPPRRARAAASARPSAPRPSSGSRRPTGRSRSTARPAGSTRRTRRGRG